MVNKYTARYKSKYDCISEGRKGKLRLDFNENTIGCSPKAIAAIKNICAEDLAAYPEYTAFKNKLAKFLEVNAKNLFLTNGADEAINLVFNTYLKRDDQLIIPTPSFEMLNIYAQNIGAKVISVLYKKNESNENNSSTKNEFIFPTKDVLAQINNRTKLVVLVNPNNPTGTVIDEKDILKIVEKARKNNAIVLIDEAYYEFYGKTCIRLVRKYNNLIIVRTFSKAFGLAGLRLGYAIADERLINNLKKISSPYNVNSIAVIAADAALDDVSYVKKYVDQITESRRFVEDGLNKLGFKTFKSEANFMIADFGEDVNKVVNGLAQKGILVRDRSRYQLLKDCVRITLGTKDQSIKFITEIKKILRQKVILFDLDGVLVDVNNSYRLAIKKTSEFFAKKKISDKEIQALKAKGGYNNDWDLTEAIILTRSLKIEKQKIIQKFQEFYNLFRKNEKLLIKIQTLQDLSKKYRLGIVTGRPRDEAGYVLNRFNVLKFFDAIIAMEDCGKKQKPDPFGINLALKRLKIGSIGKKDALYIGDNIDDIIAAKNAGIKAIAILQKDVNSESLKKRMLNLGALKILDDINQLPSVIA